MNYLLYVKILWLFKMVTFSKSTILYELTKALDLSKTFEGKGD